jgi:hypothetical protein
MGDAVEPALNAFAITLGDRFPAAETSSNSSSGSA